VEVPLDRVKEVHDQIIEATDEWISDYRAETGGDDPEYEEIKE
jgi:hypothetical protein